MSDIGPPPVDWGQYTIKGPTGFMLSNGGKLVVEIKNDGTVRFGEGYTPDSAAKEFFEQIAKRWATACQKP